MTVADKKEADREKRRLKLLDKVKTETPFPDGPDDLKKRSKKWENVDVTNVHNIKKIIATLAPEDVPGAVTFRQDGGKGTDRGWISTYVKFLIEDHATQKRKATTHLDREEKKARGAFDLRFEGLDQDARHAAWRAEIWNGKEVTLSEPKFLARTGPEVGALAFHRALKKEQRAATLTKAEADGKVREMTREVKPPDAWQPGQPNDGAMPFGAGTDEMTGAWAIGDEASDYVRSIVEKAAARRGVSLDDMGVDVAHFLLKVKSSQEQKLRRHGMDNIGRSVTKAVTTIRDLGLLGVWAGERCSSQLVAELREAPTDAPDVVVLGDRNRCDVQERLTTCGDAPSIGFGAAAGGVLGGDVASRGKARSGRFGAADRRAAAVSDEAPASLGAAVEGYDKVPRAS